VKRPGSEECKEFGESEIGILDLDNVPTVTVGSWREDYRRSPGCSNLGSITGIGKEGDLSLAGVIKTGKAVHPLGLIADNPSAKILCQFLQALFHITLLEIASPVQGATFWAALNLERRTSDVELFLL
jgi:hypothetical protein